MLIVALTGCETTVVAILTPSRPSGPARPRHAHPALPHTIVMSTSSVGLSRFVF